MAKGSVARTHARTVSRKRPRSYGVRGLIEAAGAAYLAHVAKKEYEKPSNTDTNINLNSAFNATSLYSRNNQKKRKLSVGVKKKKLAAKKFKKKVKKVFTKFLPWSTYTDNLVNRYHITTAPNASATVQDVFGLGASAEQLLVAYGTILDAGLKDVSHIVAISNSYGHVEDNAAAVPSTVNPPNFNFVKFYFKVRMEFDIICQNVEVTDSNPLYMDIYECVANRNINDVNYANPGQAWSQCHADNLDPATFGTDTVDYPGARGNVPQEAPGFSKWWKVTQVTRIRIASAAPYHYKLFTGGLWDVRKYANLYCVKGITKGIIIVAAPIQLITKPSAYDISVSGVSKHFKFKEALLDGKEPIMDVKNTRFVG